MSVPWLRGVGLGGVMGPGRAVAGSHDGSTEPLGPRAVASLLFLKTVTEIKISCLTQVPILLCFLLLRGGPNPRPGYSG